MAKVSFCFHLYSWLSLCSSELAPSIISNISVIPVFAPYLRLSAPKFPLSVIYCGFQIMNGRFNFQKQLVHPEGAVLSYGSWSVTLTFTAISSCTADGCVLVAISWACLRHRVLSQHCQQGKWKKKFLITGVSQLLLVSTFMRGLELDFVNNNKC